MMRPRPTALLMTLIILSVLPGCGIGYNRTLFVTKTNVGFEASTEPPTLQLDIARVEGVVTPQFQNGQKLPVLASFRFRTSGVFSPAVGSTFATGDAATTLAALYGDATPYGNWEDRGKIVKEGPLRTDSTVTLTQEPTVRWLPSWLGWLEWVLPKPEFQTTDVRPVFFGTDTTLGLKVAWTGMTGGYPDSAIFGYNRKELALVPISKHVDGAAYRMKMSSLLATVDSGVSELKRTDGAPGSTVQHIQYFATGNAATLLALQQEVRQAMLARLDPHKEDFKRVFAARVAPQTYEIVTRALTGVYDGLAALSRRRPDPDLVAAEHIKRLDALGSLPEVPATFEEKGFIYYSFDPGSKTLEKSTKYPVSAAKTFPRVIAYLSTTRNSIVAIRRVQEAGDVSITLKIDGGSPVTAKLPPSERQLLDAQLKLQESDFQALDQKLRSHLDVIEASRYFASQVYPRPKEEPGATDSAAKP